MINMILYSIMMKYFKPLQGILFLEDVNYILTTTCYEYKQCLRGYKIMIEPGLCIDVIWS